ncbi:MAG: hypothetical protein L6N96_00675, partial [Candidatus Methylarchaceae archaeon HK02M2]|nr:hypothetical protein [Candidatus Methylarchaceae archaeon HK02M2]
GVMVFGVLTSIVFLFSFASSQAWALTLRNLIIPNSIIIIGIAAASISSLFAWTMGLKRLYIYGLLTLATSLIGHFITIPFEYFLVTIGLVITINGFVLLMQSIRKYPLTHGDKTFVKKFF